ncbi:hypothetical protein PR048_017267 [Dryococelus australis]|uniref:Large ribosomal subunit protein uL11m n=1 Tax=Dryococelus australis TaxID=614101 RepID=A0ABQ9H966_9NEOP|nr:hypothetical protein PR048_017267 [Dryococelus australis]
MSFSLGGELLRGSAFINDELEIFKFNIKTHIKAGSLENAEPMGSICPTYCIDDDCIHYLQRTINIAAFCKDFNERTKDMKEGIPIPCRVSVNPDRSYELVMHKPPATFYLKQAAGIQRGAMSPGQEVCGKITLKHLYEIAKLKSEDPPLECMSLEDICKMMVGVAHSCGIEVVKELDPVEYGQFLEERKIIVEDQLKELQEKKEARILRTA